MGGAATLDIDLESLDAAGAIFVFDPSGETGVADVLLGIGLKVEVRKQGSEVMQAAQAGDVAGVVVAPETDVELRQLFIRAFRQRHAQLPVLYLTPDPSELAEEERLLEEGASAVAPWPLEANQLALILASLAPDAAERGPPEAAFVPAAADDAAVVPDGQGWEEQAETDEAVFVPPLDGLNRAPEAEAAVLERKLGDLESEPALRPSADRLVPADRFEAAVQEAAEHAVENTELRSELTLVRERNGVLEDRVGRLKAQIRSLTRERDALLHGDEPSTPTVGLAELLGGTESYLYAMHLAIEFLEDLQHRVGKRAPSLDTHLRTMKLVKQLLHRLQDQVQRGTPTDPGSSENESNLP